MNTHVPHATITGMLRTLDFKLTERGKKKVPLSICSSLDVATNQLNTSSAISYNFKLVAFQ